MRRGGLLTIALLSLLPPTTAAQTPPVHVVLFTHVEDNTPGGTLGSTQNRNSYILWRDRLIGVANLMRNAALPWSLQPDWKILRSALLWEDAALMQNTNGKNLFRYLREDLDVIIDPHSHEGSGYNYTDVAHLIDSLGVPPTTVIGGHVWDPSLPQFQEWDRFRVPVSGQMYPWASWRGDILMGSGTPGHVNDPLVSGVWRPQDRDHYFTHDVGANMVAVGAYKSTIESIPELIALYATGQVAPPFMLTANYNIRPSMIQRPDGLVSITDSIIGPVDAWRDAGTVLPTDFTSLVAIWQSQFGSYGWLHDAETPPSDAIDRRPASALRSFPNPFTRTTQVHYALANPTHVRLRIFDVAGRTVADLADGVREPGRHTASWTAPAFGSGVYFCRLEAAGTTLERKLILTR